MRSQNYSEKSSKWFYSRFIDQYRVLSNSMPLNSVCKFDVCVSVDSLSDTVFCRNNHVVSFNLMSGEEEILPDMHAHEPSLRRLCVNSASMQAWIVIAA